MCSRRKINIDLSNKIDNLLISCDSTDSSQLNNSFFERVDLSIRSESNKLPEVLTILSSYVPTCRLVPIKFRTRWSQLLSGTLLDFVEAPDNETNWQKLFAVSKSVLRACNRGGKKQKRNQDQRLAEHFDCWNAGEHGKLRSEAVSLKQSKRQRTNSIEEISVRGKTMCLQSHYSRAAKV